MSDDYSTSEQPQSRVRDSKQQSDGNHVHSGDDWGGRAEACQLMNEHT